MIVVGARFDCLLSSVRSRSENKTDKKSFTFGFIFLLVFCVCAFVFDVFFFLYFSSCFFEFILFVFFCTKAKNRFEDASNTLALEMRRHPRRSSDPKRSPKRCLNRCLKLFKNMHHTEKVKVQVKVKVKGKR